MAIKQKLTPGEMYLYCLLKDPSGLDQAEFLWKTGEEDTDYCWRAWPFQWKWFTDTSPLQIEQSSRCLKEDTLVLTDDGWIPIQDVRVGQQVLTHRNRWRKVTEVYDNGVKPVVAVRGQGPADPLVMTADHQFWGSHAVRASQPKDGHKGKKLLPPRWMTPAEFKANDGSGQMDSNWASPAEVEPLPLPSQLVPAYRSGRQNIVKDIFTVPFMWMLGLYLAEGSTWISDKNCTIRWSVHVDEVQHVTDVLDQTGLRWNISKVNASDKCVNVCVNSRPVAVFLQEHCGHGAANKKIPTWAYGLSDPLKEAILDGVHYGDSHRRSSGRDETSTVSYPLALGVKVLAQTLNYSASVMVARQAGQTTIRGRTYESRKAYSTSTYPLEFQKRAHVQIRDGHAWSPINEVLPDGLAQTWDLEIEEDNSFVANGVVVHNSVGKTTSILVRLFSFVFLYAGKEAVITAPELVHLNPIINLIENSITDCRLTRDMLKKRGAGNGITHRPFAVEFKNNAHIFGRIPQKTGAGIKGTHPIVLEMDEAQDYGEPGWAEIMETLKMGFRGASWRVHGVTRGVRDTFFRLTQPDSGWKVHKYSAMWRPTWTDEERQAKILLYGSRESPDYKRNIRGMHGDESSPFVVLARLLRCADRDEVSEYNREYRFIKIDDGTVNEYGGDMDILLPLPQSHLSEDRLAFYGGADIGYTIAPTEITIWAAERPDPSKDVKYRLLTRVQLNRIDHRYQVEVFMHLIDFYDLKVMAMDKSGLGLPLFQDMQNRSPRHAEVIKGYNFSEKILVAIDETVDVDEHRDNPVEKAGIKKNVLEQASDVLRTFVDEGRLILPWDKDLIGEFQGQEYVVKKDLRNVYGRKVYNTGKFHVLDSARMFALGVTQAPMEELWDRSQNPRKYAEPVVDIFL